MKTEFTEDLGSGFSEDEVWERRVKPLLQEWPQNVIHKCAYGFTEMMNNANDHSGADEVHVALELLDDRLTVTILDPGVGVFQNIINKLHLDNVRHAIFELTKGKVTTDPDNHTGEGIFFTSRMCETFWIGSGLLFLAHTDSGDWLLEDREPTSRGTIVKMQFKRNSTTTMKEVFDRYSSSGEDDYGFKKTKVPVALSDEGDVLISRSQAKRVLSRLERFQEVILDFRGIKSIGPAFADEIFRVFQRNHPEVKFVTFGANDEVTQMISKATAEASQDPATR